MRNGKWASEAKNAKVYIGSHFCYTFPNKIEPKKTYTFGCDDAVGDFIKIVTGRNDTDQKLTFSLVKVYSRTEEE